MFAPAELVGSDFESVPKKGPKTSLPKTFLKKINKNQYLVLKSVEICVMLIQVETYYSF